MPHPHGGRYIEQATPAQVIAGCWVVYWIVVTMIWWSGLIAIPWFNRFICDTAFCLTLLLIVFSSACAASRFHFILTIIFFLLGSIYLINKIYRDDISLEGTIFCLSALLILLILCPLKEIITETRRYWLKNDLKSTTRRRVVDEVVLSDIEPVQDNSRQFKPAEGDECLDDARVEIYKHGRKKLDGRLFVTRKGLICRPIGVKPEGGRAVWSWQAPCQPLVEISRHEIKFTVVLKKGDKLCLYASRPSQTFRELCMKIETLRTRRNG